MPPFQRRIVPALLLLLVAVLPLAVRAESMPFGQGLLWRVEKAGGAHSYVFGTMHTADPRVVALPAAVAEAFEEADSVTVEVVPDDAGQLRTMQLMVLQNGQSLDQIVGADLFAKATEVGQLHYLPAEAVARLKPWALAVTLGISLDDMARMATGELPLDRRLEQEARASGKALYGLETADEQLGLFDGLPAEDQRQLLAWTLEMYPQFAAYHERTREAYLQGNTEGVFALAAEFMVGDHEFLARWFVDQVITQRNHRMAERLSQRLAEGGAFIAVGAAHLPGAEGLLRLIEQQGYQVTRIY